MELILDRFTIRITLLYIRNTEGNFGVFLCTQWMQLAHKIHPIGLFHDSEVIIMAVNLKITTITIILGGLNFELRRILSSESKMLEAQFKRITGLVKPVFFTLPNGAMSLVPPLSK